MVVCRVVVSVGAVGGLVSMLGSGAVREGLRGLPASAVVVALAVGFVGAATSAARWWLVARSVGRPIAFLDALARTYRATMLNSLVPGGVLGDVERVAAAARRGGRESASVVVVERVAGQLVVMTAATGIALADSHMTGAIAGAVRSTMCLVVVGAVVLTAALYAGWTYRNGRAELVLRALSTVARQAAQILRAPRLACGVAVLSLLAMGGYLTLFVSAARTVDTEISTTRLVSIGALALVAMAIPVSVGGWGPREAAAAVGFGLSGLEAADGVATAVVYGLLTLVSCSPGLAVFAAPLVRGRLALAEENRTVAV